MRTLPTITKNLLIINVLAFLASLALEGHGMDLNNAFGLHFFLAPDFHLYQLITYMFMHGGWSHIFFNMLALWMFGYVVENTWGARKFLFYYMACGIGAGLMQEAVQYVSYLWMGFGSIDAHAVIQIGSQLIMKNAFLNSWTTVGASGAIYGVLLAFGMLYPNERIFFFPIPIPIKAKWFIIIYVVAELYFALMTKGDDVAHFAHLGGMLFGWLIIRHWRNHPSNYTMYGRSRGQQAFDRMKNFFGRHGEGSFSYRRNDAYSEPERNTGADERMREEEKQREIDRILDKIRKSGYDSLTADEKRTLFEASK